MKKNASMVIFFFGLLGFWQWSYFKFREHFNDSKEIIEQNKTLKVSLLREQARLDLITFKYEIFRQNVAQLIPSVKVPQSDLKQIRGLASVVQKENPEILKYSNIESKIQTAMDHFADRKYKQVIQEVNDILVQDPITPTMVTLYFILAESYYQTHELNLCVQVSEKMMSMFPENEKTGLVLLRVGMLLKEKNRLQEAKETWQVVATAYLYSKELQEQVKKMMSSLEKSE